jgi:hypothetical protein
MDDAGAGSTSTSVVRAYPQIDYYATSRWDSSPINCPRCNVSYSRTSGDCGSPSAKGGGSFDVFYEFTRNVAANGSCSESGTLSFSDPDTGWSRTHTINIGMYSTATTCTPASPSTQDQWVAASATCPAGQSGSHTWEKEQRNTSTCPSSTGAPVWSGWTDTGNTRNVVNTCSTVCTPGSRTQWIAASGSCPAGQTGTVSWEKEQRQDQNPSCTTWSAWSDTGSTRNTVSSCAVPDFPGNLKAGCYVDTKEFDPVSQGSCSASGNGARHPAQQATIVFSAGELSAPDYYYTAKGWSFTWSGSCSGSGTMCTISAPACDSTKVCPGLGSRSATVVVSNGQGQSVTLSVSASDSTTSSIAGSPPPPEW